MQIIYFIAVVLGCGHLAAAFFYPLNCNNPAAVVKNYANVVSDLDKAMAKLNQINGSAASNATNNSATNSTIPPNLTNSTVPPNLANSTNPPNQTNSTNPSNQTNSTTPAKPNPQTPVPRPAPFLVKLARSTLGVLRNVLTTIGNVIKAAIGIFTSPFRPLGRSILPSLLCPIVKLFKPITDVLKNIGRGNITPGPLTFITRLADRANKTFQNFLRALSGPFLNLPNHQISQFGNDVSNLGSQFANAMNQAVPRIF